MRRPPGPPPADLAFLEGYVQNPDPAQKAEQERLCRVDPAVPWSIIAITFTNKAAGELKERLERMLGPSANDIWASTFHSACVRILRRDIDRLGFTSSFTIYDTADSERVIKDIVKDFNLDEKAFAPPLHPGLYFPGQGRHEAGEGLPPGVREGGGTTGW